MSGETHAQKVKRTHQENQKERVKLLNEKKLSYKRIKDEAALVDILTKAGEFAAYHTKLAKDGVGYRNTGESDKSGNPVQEVVYYSSEKRLSELDKAAGIEELKAYIEGHLTEEFFKPVKPKKVVVDQ